MSAFVMSPLKALAVLASGALFGFGLSVSTMVRPEVVLGFLRFNDMGLMLVMGGAVAVVLIAYKLAPRLMQHPVFDDHFHAQVIPPANEADGRAGQRVDVAQVCG